MISEQKFSNKSFIVTKHAQPTMDNKFSNLSQVAAISFKHAKGGKSFIPNVPVNYTYSKRQKAGKSFIPRFTVIYSNKTKNGKPSLSHVNDIKYFNSKKDKISISYEPVKKNRRSYIPRRVTKKVEPLPCRIQEKPQQTSVKPKPKLTLFGKSKIPVPTTTTTKKANISKKQNISNRTSHSRICTSTKNEDARVSRFNTIQDDQVRVLTSVKRFDAQIHVLTFDVVKKDDASSRASTPSSINRSLIPVRNLTNNLFKKRVSPLQPTLASVKKDEVFRIPTFTSNKKSNNIVCISLKNNHTRLQKSVNKPEASISIIEISTTTSIIKPELSSISLLYKAEKDLSSRHQIEEVGEDVSSSLFGNVVKKIVRFSKDLFSKMIK